MKHTNATVAAATALAAMALLAGCGKNAAATTTSDHMMSPSPSDSMMHDTISPDTLSPDTMSPTTSN